MVLGKTVRGDLCTQASCAAVKQIIDAPAGALRRGGQTRQLGHPKMADYIGPHQQQWPKTPPQNSLMAMYKIWNPRKRGPHTTFDILFTLLKDFDLNDHCAWINVPCIVCVRLWELWRFSGCWGRGRGLLCPGPLEALETTPYTKQSALAAFNILALTVNWYLQMYFWLALVQGICVIKDMQF